MKCPHCGGEITLEQKYCPYCGNLNEAAQKHVADMAHYQRAYEETENELRQKSRRFSGVWVRLVILAGVILLTIATMIVTSNYYSIRSDSLQREAARNAESYTRILDDCLEQQDYLSFYSFVHARSIRPYADEFRNYECVYWAVNEYVLSYEYLMDIVCGRNAERNVGYLNTSLDSFYRYQDEERWRDIEDSQAREKYLGYYQNITDNLNGLLKVYLGLSDQQIKELAGMTTAKRGALLEDQALKLYPKGFEEGQS